MVRLVPVARSCAVLTAAILLAACGPAAVTPSMPRPASASALPAATAGATPAAATPRPTPTPTPVVVAGEPWIAFQQFLAKSTVMLVRPDGSGLHSPTRDVPGGDQTNPDWSPDGSRLVMAVVDGGREDLWVVDADGTDARRLADCTDDCVNLDDPAWSPDGDRVLFSRFRVGADDTVVSSLEVVDVTTGATTVIVEAEPGHFYAGQRWSPDGASIVLEVVELAGPTADAAVENVSLAIIDVETPTPAGRELLGSKRFPETAAWAPDGRTIVFGALEAPGAAELELFRISPDGTGLRRIGDDVRGTHPEVTPDGTAVIFTATVPDSSQPVLGQVPMDGGDVLPATGTTFIPGVHPRMRPTP